MFFFLIGWLAVYNIRQKRVELDVYFQVQKLNNSAYILFVETLVLRDRERYRLYQLCYVYQVAHTDFNMNIK
jgi:hypothetical protein